MGFVVSIVFEHYDTPVGAGFPAGFKGLELSRIRCVDSPTMVAIQETI